MDTKLTSRVGPVKVLWKAVGAASLALVMAGSVGVGTASIAQAARVTDDESRYNLVEKFDVGLPVQVALGSMKPYDTTVNPRLLLWCFDLGAGVGAIAPPAVALDDPRGAEANWLMDYASKSTDPKVHARVGFLLHDFYDTKGTAFLVKAAEKNPLLAQRIAESKDLLAVAEQNAGPYTAPTVTVTPDNITPLVKNTGTVTVTVGAPKSANGVAQNDVDLNVKLENGGVFESTGKAEAVVKPGASLKATGAPAGQVNVTASVVGPLPGSGLFAHYAPDGPERQQNLIGAGPDVSLRGAGNAFLKWGQELSSQVLFQGGYDVRDTIKRSTFLSGTKADITGKFYITGQKATEAGIPAAPADAVEVDTVLAKDVDKAATTPAFDAAKIEKAVTDFRAKNPAVTNVTGYIVLSTPENDDNRGYVSNHLISAESVTFVAPEKPEVPRTPDVPRVEAGTPVVMLASAIQPAETDGSVFVAGGVALAALALLVGAGAVVRHRRTDRA